MVDLRVWNGSGDYSALNGQNPTATKNIRLVGAGEGISSRREKSRDDFNERELLSSLRAIVSRLHSLEDETRSDHS